MTSYLGLVRAGGEPIIGSWWFCFNAADAEVPDVGKTLEDESFSLNDKSDFVVDAFPLMSSSFKVSNKSFCFSFSVFVTHQFVRLCECFVFNFKLIKC